VPPCSVLVTKRRKGETKEGGGKEAGNREAHAGNRADLATQADLPVVKIQSLFGARNSMSKRQNNVLSGICARPLTSCDCVVTAGNLHTFTGTKSRALQRTASALRSRVEQTVFSPCNIYITGRELVSDHYRLLMRW
jgi:hypothetical protein